MTGQANPTAGRFVEQQPGELSRGQSQQEQD